MFSLTMLGSGSAGNSALVATDHCRLLVDGGLSAPAAQRSRINKFELVEPSLEEIFIEVVGKNDA